MQICCSIFVLSLGAIEDNLDLSRKQNEDKLEVSLEKKCLLAIIIFLVFCFCKGHLLIFLCMMAFRVVWLWGDFAEILIMLRA